VPFRLVRMIWILVAAVLAVAAVSLAMPASAQADPGDIGYRDQHFSGNGTSVTGAKPESKLWWNDGLWWASIWDEAAGDNTIHRLDIATQTWVNTGVTLDPRTGTRADTLWDGTHLYVASHIYSNTSSSGSPAYLYRYSYQPIGQTYTLDSGFPVAISQWRTEALVMDKDSTGRLWATWVQAGTVYVNATTGDDTSWGTPFALPVDGASGLSTDDISSVIAFGGSRIGVMWSNQTTSVMHFAVHNDADPVGTWQPSEAALSGAGMADDHINLKADSTGRVFAATKTSLTSTNDPLVMLLVRDPAGSWSPHTYGRVTDHHTRPIVLLDESAGVITMFATSAEAGGTVYKKTSPIDAISFAVGRGTPFVMDATSQDMNDATSTKGDVSQMSGLVVLASDDTTDYYWHNYDSLVLSADFSASVTSGAAPLSVAFTDRSSGNPTSWIWDFGDGATSTEQNPIHVYTTAGAYAVTLTAANGSGASTTTMTDPVVVVTPSVSFTSTADSWVKQSAPTKNYGTHTSLSVKSTSTRTYVQFQVTGLAEPVLSARIRLFVQDPSANGGRAYLVGSAWTETGITWSNAPALQGTALGSAGAIATGTWAEIPIPASIFAGGDGTYSFAIADGSSDTAGYQSRQGPNPPQLVLGVPGT